MTHSHTRTHNSIYISHRLHEQNVARACVCVCVDEKEKLREKKNVFYFCVEKYMLRPVHGSINYVDDKMRWQNFMENKWWGVSVRRNVLNTNWTQIMVMALWMNRLHCLLACAHVRYFFRLHASNEWSVWWKVLCYVFDGLFTKLMNKLLYALNFSSFSSSLFHTLSHPWQPIKSVCYSIHGQIVV